MNDLIHNIESQPTMNATSKRFRKIQGNIVILIFCEKLYPNVIPWKSILRNNSCFPSFFNSLIFYTITGYLHCFVLVISSAQFVAVALFTLNRRSAAKSFTFSNAASAASLFALSAFTCRSVNNQKSVTCIRSTFSVRLGKG